jgi:hypothetical protein
MINMLFDDDSDDDDDDNDDDRFKLLIPLTTRSRVWEFRLLDKHTYIPTCIYVYTKFCDNFISVCSIFLVRSNKTLSSNNES